MAKRTSAIDFDPVLSRKRTADLLKQLRSVTRELQRLKTYVAELESRDDAARVARDVIERHRSAS